MSHELRTPLNAILLYSELLIDEVQERGVSDLGRDLDRIRGAGRHLLGLIDDILDLSKIEAGRMSVFLEDCDVPALIAEVAATVGFLVAKNRNRLVLEADPAIRVLTTDQKKLRQVLYNLLSNASKFTQDGTIALRVLRDPLDEGRACFVVSDNGIGMNPEQLERIFLEFTQAEDFDLPALRRYRTGADPLPEIRATARGYHPGGQRARERGQLHALPAWPAAATGPLPGCSLRWEAARPRVDDRRRSRSAGGPLADAHQGGLPGGPGRAMGLDGLELARALRPQLITLDIAMPGFDGWQVLARLKADPELKHIPVVVITILDDRARGFALEASEYLQKPIHREQLLEVVHRLVPRDRGSDPGGRGRRGHPGRVEADPGRGGKGGGGSEGRQASPGLSCEA